jgi:hypothetical protein
MRSADRSATRVEIWIGHSLAMFVHPVAAARMRPVSARLVWFSGCLTLSYVVVLAALAVLRP